MLLRCTPLQRGGWLFFLVCSVVLAVAAFWELLEWWTALVAADNTVMAGLLQNMGAELAGHGPGTVDYVVALDRAGEYSLDSWFRSVDDGRVFSSR